MQRQIITEVRDVYGNMLVYPVCETAKRFCQLTGRKTFTHADLCHIEALGYEIVDRARSWRAA